MQTIVAVRAAQDSRADLAAREIEIFEDFLVGGIDNDAIDAELDVRVHPDDPFVIVYTSGTTSRPKGCLHTFNTYASAPVL